MDSIMNTVLAFLLVSLWLGLVESFAPLSTTMRSKSTTWDSQLSMSAQPSRRDVLQKTAVATAATFVSPDIARAITEQSAANKANESFQGVYFDPNHPGGYRIIRATDSGKVTMTLSDGVPNGSAEQPKTFSDIPVTVENQDEFIFDFSFKNGPKNIKGKLSSDKKAIVFEDGNTWTKNYYKYDGIYKVSSGGTGASPNAYRVVRKNGPEIIAEINDTGNPKDSYFVDGSIGSLFAIPTCSLTFYFGGKDKALEMPEPNFMDALRDFQRGDDGPKGDNGVVVGQFSLQDSNTVFPYGTITFPDKTVWTRI